MKQNTETNVEHKVGYYLKIGLLIIFLLIINCLYFNRRISSNHALAVDYIIKDDPLEKYRNPAVVGLFYPLIGTDKHCPQIIIAPHSGSQYGDSLIERAYAPLRQCAKQIKNVIWLAPSHSSKFKGASLPDFKFMKTPLGKIAINTPLIEKLADNRLFQRKSAVYRQEQSLKKHLSFWQKSGVDFTLVPIFYSDITAEEIASDLLPYLHDKSVVLVVSADLSADRRLSADHHANCGTIGVDTALILSSELNLKPQVKSIIVPSQGDEHTLGDESRTADGNLSTLEKEYQRLKDFGADFGEQMLSAARKSLDKAVKGRVYRPHRRSYNEHLFDKGAVFVTLRQNGKLRGYKGSLYPRQAVVADITSNARAVAMDDELFSPLLPSDLPEVKVSLSLLTGYEKINYQGEADLLQKLRPHIDGVVIRDGNRQGLFLPSAWQQFPDKKEFLNNLKLKAGMSPSFWSDDIRVYRFRTVEIKENGY